MADPAQSPLINPKEITIEDRKGTPCVYLLSEIPALESREIVSQYPTSALPKIGDYALNEQMLFKMMAYVAVPIKGSVPLRLTTRVLINNHVPDLNTLAKLEIAMSQYNWDFFLPENLSDLSGRVKRILTTFLTQIMTDSLRQSSEASKPPTTNSEPSTP